ncbi:RecBCD enzyme subunit RecB [Candidatus Ecksteinia adelgidicola]|nr:RecBCD enzyme subunit RecB [Candidatus Ecksteinia adelgidicola]
MTHKTIQQLDLIKLPLLNAQLIEASAGTGKTFTISMLYLRLLLGLTQDTAFSRPLTVKEILVLTFTEIATKELIERIRINIHKFRLVCMRNKSQDKYFSLLLNKISNFDQAICQLRLAEQQMDEASIFTIHSFSKQILTKYPLESKIFFKKKIVKNELLLYKKACIDFWRRCCYKLPLEISCIINKEWSGPDELLSDIIDYLHGEVPSFVCFSTEKETLLSRHEKIIAHIKKIKLDWRKTSNNLQELIIKFNLNKRSYNNKNISRWIYKIDKWAIQETLDYQLPKELNKFRQSFFLKESKQDKVPTHSLFIAIDILFNSSLTLRDLFISDAIIEIRSLIWKEKCQQATLGFDDLIRLLNYALHGIKGEELSQSIRHSYPIAIIDEFQDTDPEQYRIFEKIYINQLNCALLLIGDPKQAIYTFRGANIFTYMKVRSVISSIYTLKINWRSSSLMVESINILFSQVEKPFIFNQIPFIKTYASKKNDNLFFKLNNKSQPAIKFWLQQRKNIKISDYRKFMARLCAAHICDWLIAGKKGKAWIGNKESYRLVNACNIVVLVRNRDEGMLIYNALSALLIPSVYLSNHDSVFRTLEAKDVLWLLKSILNPEDECTLRCAISTELIGLDAHTLFTLINNENTWNSLVDEFNQYRVIWKNKGILLMLHEVIKTRCLLESILSTPHGKRRLTNILHLSELLQEASLKFNTEHGLIQWFMDQIVQPDVKCNNQQLRLEEDNNIVRIISIHKSKGLEFDLVWLPFISSFREQDQALYHDRHSFKLLLDLQYRKKSLILAEEERLSEDLRLLYVALTRSIYHTSIGIAPIVKNINKTNSTTDLHRSALGYLVQSGQSGDTMHLNECLKKLVNHNYIDYETINVLNETIYQEKLTNFKKLDVKNFTRKIKDFWKIISYTSLIQHHENAKKTIPIQLKITKNKTILNKNNLIFSPHTFPRGKFSGIFLHSLLEILDFKRKVDKKWLLEQLQKKGFSDQWQPILEEWINQVVVTPLNNFNLTLSLLKKEHKQSEFKFYLSINQLLKVRKLDKLMKQYDPLSISCPELDFKKIYGILRGSIDLVFFWKEKYYLLDYKSNWLGKDSSAYTQLEMKKAIIEHRYDLQYQIYTLALHRYLRHRITDYSYQKNFGGVIYLFLRGMTKNHLNNGIFTCFPSKKLIEGIDCLFENKNII